ATPGLVARSVRSRGAELGDGRSGTAAVRPRRAALAALHRIDHLASARPCPRGSAAKHRGSPRRALRSAFAAEHPRATAHPWARLVPPLPRLAPARAGRPRGRPADDRPRDENRSVPVLGAGHRRPATAGLSRAQDAPSGGEPV
ncbi:MAG: hypothetical protein AVDCRST_MAG19-3147, partial [uncultured Thermomicrobiales bacterium]